MITTEIGLKEEIISSWVKTGSTVLELGCGNGVLLNKLKSERGAVVHGIEIDDSSVRECVRIGLDVLHESADGALADYSDNTFDYVIFNDSMQRVVNKPDEVLVEALRVGKRIIVTVPNFAHIKARSQIFFLGRTPVTASLPYEWYNTPNLHFLSIADILAYFRKKDIKLEAVSFISGNRLVKAFPNLRALTGVFLISK
ncbi:MAG: methionine biosynthesis protein MetW [Actinomycetota bacterium]